MATNSILPSVLTSGQPNVSQPNTNANITSENATSTSTNSQDAFAAALALEIAADAPMTFASDLSNSQNPQGSTSNTSMETLISLLSTLASGQTSPTSLAPLLNVNTNRLGLGSLPVNGTGRSWSAQSTNQWLLQNMLQNSPFSNLSGGISTIASPNSPTSADVNTAVQAAAAKYGIPENLIRGIIQQESGGNPNAVSPAGALGLMQLMPATARELSVANPFDIHQNIAGGTRYFASLLQKYNGDTPLALAAYNAGSGAVDKYQGIPPYPETRAYVANVLSLSNSFAAQA